MKFKYWILGFVVIFIVGVVVAQSLSNERQNFGEIQFSTPNKLPKQTIGNCEIGDKIIPFVDIIYLDEKKKILNYTLKISFDGQCVQGMDGRWNDNKTSQHLDYSSSPTYQEAIKNDIISRFNNLYSERTTKLEVVEPVVKGKYE